MSVQSAFQLPVLHSTSSASRCTLKRLLILVLRCTTKEDADYTCPWIIETTEKVIYLVNILGWLILFDVWRQQRGLQRHLFWETCKTGGWFYLPEGTLIQFKWCLTVAFSLRVFSNIYILSLFVVPIFQHYFTLKPLWHACPSPRCGHQKKKKKTSDSSTQFNTGKSLHRNRTPKDTVLILRQPNSLWPEYKWFLWRTCIEMQIRFGSALSKLFLYSSLRLSLKSEGLVANCIPFSDTS